MQFQLICRGSKWILIFCVKRKYTKKWLRQKWAKIIIEAIKQHCDKSRSLFLTVRKPVKLAVYALHILAVCNHSMLTASSSGQHIHLVSLSFPLQPSIHCTVPISIYMEYINQVCIWSISTLCLVGPFITLFNTSITGSIKLQAPMLVYFLSVLIISFANVQKLSCQSVGIQHS